MEVLLDTNFIISCLVKKIDFLGELEEKGFRVKVPREVLDEMKDLKNSGKASHEERTMIGVALELLENKKIKKMKLGGGKVDEKLIEMGKKGIYIATLDNGIKREIPNKVIINNSRKGLEILRS
ncbi:hypothetical protein J4402_01680 [Candidatus Pacearchaeota archaeon]|nr:hypothetical protein [Candidatus Pacearchaeota archaeon]